MSLPFLIVLTLFGTTLCDEKLSRVKRIVGGIPADVPPADDPVVYTRFAGRSAKVRGIRDFPHYVFRGIKYAHPPTGKDRFLRPREKYLDGEVNATSFSQPCIQPRPGTNTVIGSEDCLALNVFTPELPTGLEGLPVIIWIHGGGFRYGSASQYGVSEFATEEYLTLRREILNLCFKQVRHLVGRRLVIVTIQYRLGSLGFLSSGDKHLPGNVALWDMVQAIQWVRNYIGFFGGNPYRIVVMGHGTGASSALLITLSKIAKDTTCGVIAMSGSAISNWAVDHSPENTAKNVADENGCPTSSTVTMVKCLQNLPPDSIIRGDSDIEFQRLRSRGFMSGLSGELGAAPVFEGYNDGRSLPGLVEDEPINDLNNAKHPKIPLLTGITRDETKRAVRGHLKKDIEHKLATIPNFLNNVLVKQLRESLFTSKLINRKSDRSSDSLVPLNFKNYLQSKVQDLHAAIDKVAEATSDALFNLPAFLTVNRWSQNGAPTFLYSFEHLGKRQKGDIFLRGSPIFGNDTIKNDEDLNNTIGHGDDLAYIFDVYDVEGNSLETESVITEDDKKVRGIFTKMISDFARYGKIQIDGRDVDSFSSKKNNFIQIKAKPSLSNNFRDCEMALWSNLAEKLKTDSCAFLDPFNLKVLTDNIPISPILINNSLINLPKPNTIDIPIVKDPLNILGGDHAGKDKHKPNSLLGGFIG